MSTLIREYSYLIMFLQEFWGIPHFSWIETPWVLRRGSWKLLGVLGNYPFSFLGFLLHPWRFYPFWVGEDDGLWNWRWRCKWEAQLEHEALFKNLGEGLFLFYGSNFFRIHQFCKTLGSPPWRAISMCWD